MSFAGHALDMIKRLQEGREPLKRRREQMKSGRINYTGTGNMPQNLTAEKFEEINQALKEREHEQQRYFSRMKLIIAGCILVVAILLLFVFNFIFIK